MERTLIHLDLDAFLRRHDPAAASVAGRCLFGRRAVRATALQDEISREPGLSCSLGVASNNLCAKIATDVAAFACMAIDFSRPKVLITRVLMIDALAKCETHEARWKATWWAVRGAGTCNHGLRWFTTGVDDLERSPTSTEMVLAQQRRAFRALRLSMVQSPF